MIQIVLDVETKKLFSEIEDRDPGKLGVSYLGLIEVKEEDSSDLNNYQGFFEKDLADLWPVLEKADRLIGFNIISFDNVALAPYYPGDLSQIPILDIMREIEKELGHRLSLDSVAKATLGLGKIGSGLSAVDYWRNGEFEKLAKYCRKDVEITTMVYDFGLKNGFLKYTDKWNSLREVKVDFSFKRPEAKVQMTLGM